MKVTALDSNDEPIDYFEDIYMLCFCKRLVTIRLRRSVVPWTMDLHHRMMR